MKTLTLLILTTLSAAPAFAAPRLNAFDALKKDAHNAVYAFTDQSDVCDVRLEETRDGYTFSVREPGKPVIYIDVTAESEITRKGRDSSDGSFSHEFTVKGEGKVEIVHMDDAYYHLYATKNGITATCELDF